MPKLPNTLSFRLTLWYSSSFVVFLAASLLILLVLIDAILEDRIDEELIEEINEFRELYKTEGIERVKTEIDLEGKTGDISEIFLRLLTSNGEQIHSSDLTHWEGITTVQSILEKISEDETEILLLSVEFQSQEEETRVAYGLIGPELILNIGESTEDKEEIMEILFIVFTAMFVIAVPIIATIGWFIARKNVVGIEEINRAAIDIKSGQFNRRVSIENQHDEIQTLANTFNKMAERINQLITEMREMIDNIAHDLRSPLARIRAISENALSRESSKEEYQSAAENTLEECDRMIQMVNNTLDVAEAEAGVTEREKEEINLANLIEEACELFEPVAEEKNVVLTFTLNTSCYLNGNRQSLQRMASNLLDNAIKYTKPNTSVDIKLDKDSNLIKISISDKGEGIPTQSQHRIFDRFYRCDSSRSKEGSGLGLSYAKAVARSHGGDIILENSSKQGSTFVISLPI